MQTIQNIIRQLSSRKTANSAPQCNYRDNYYGDRICVIADKR